MRAYAQSKLAQIMSTFELAERLRNEGVAVTVNALHPASLMNTKMVHESFGYARRGPTSRRTTTAHASACGG
jgi:NAD(P)-dependent dehydrogenase (short-subunit alcohol dehydrogenase family)